MQTFKTAYLYCPKTGRFLNEVLCFYAPEQKRYPLPPHATFAMPGSASSFFDGKVWHDDLKTAAEPIAMPDAETVFQKLSRQHPLEEFVEALLLYIIGRPKKLLALSLMFHQLEEEGV